MAKTSGPGQDLDAGLLDTYKRNASFDLSYFQDYIWGSRNISIIRKILKIMEKDPLFQANDRELTGEISMDELRHLSHKRTKRLFEYQFNVGSIQAVFGLFLYPSWMFFKYGVHLDVSVPIRTRQVLRKRVIN